MQFLRDKKCKRGQKIKENPLCSLYRHSILELESQRDDRMARFPQGHGYKTSIKSNSVTTVKPPQQEFKDLGSSKSKSACNPTV